MFSLGGGVLPSTRRQKSNATITGRFGFVNEENSSRLIIVTISYSKSSVYSERFLSTRRRKPGVFKFLRSEQCLRKAPFSWRLSVDSKPNRRNPTDWKRLRSALISSSCVFLQGYRVEVLIKKTSYAFYNLSDVMARFSKEKHYKKDFSEPLTIISLVR